MEVPHRLSQGTESCLTAFHCFCILLLLLLLLFSHKSCPTLLEPHGCSPPGSSVHGISQARILENTFASPEDLPDPETEPLSPALQVDSSLIKFTIWNSGKA